MRKRGLIAGVGFLLTLSLLVACGIPKEKYESTVSELGQAQQELQSVKADLEKVRAELQATQAKLETTRATLEKTQADLTGSGKEVSSLQTSLQKAKDDVQAQQRINLALSDELKKVKYPRHFTTLAELTDWVRADDTNVKYTSENVVNRTFILQVRALMDGYLLPMGFYADGTTMYVTNRAVIGDAIFSVRANDDNIVRYGTVSPLPSRPISPP